MMYIDIPQKTKVDIKALHWNYIQNRCSSIERGRKQNRKQCLINHLDAFEKQYRSQYRIPKNLGKSFFDDLEIITCGEFTDLLKMKRKYSCLHIKYQIIHKDEKVRNLNKYEKDLYDLGVRIRKFLDYDTFNKLEETSWGTRRFLIKIRESVCPYCNAQYIYVSSKDDGIKPQIDHFFPKAEYPIFSCSIYNMVPSCYNCNHTKSDKEKNILSPYVRGFYDDASFGIKMGSRTLSNVEKVDLNENIEICLNAKENSSIKKQVENSKMIFKLEDSYNCYQIELIDLIKRIQKNNKIKVQNNCKILGTRKEFKSLILGIPLGAETKNYLFKKLKEDFWKKFHK